MGHRQGVLGVQHDGHFPLIPANHRLLDGAQNLAATAAGEITAGHNGKGVGIVSQLQFVIIRCYQFIQQEGIVAGFLALFTGQDALHRVLIDQTVCFEGEDFRVVLPFQLFLVRIRDDCQGNLGDFEIKLVYARQIGIVAFRDGNLHGVAAHLDRHAVLQLLALISDLRSLGQLHGVLIGFTCIGLIQLLIRREGTPMLDGEDFTERETIHRICHEQGILLCRCHNAKGHDLARLHTQDSSLPIIRKDIVGAFHIGIRQFGDCIPHHVHHTCGGCISSKVHVDGSIFQIRHGYILDGDAFGSLAVAVHNDGRIDCFTVRCSKVSNIHGTLTPQIDAAVIMGGELIGRSIDGQGQILPCNKVVIPIRNLNGGMGLGGFGDNLHIAYKGNARQVGLLQHSAAVYGVQLHRSSFRQLNGIGAQQIIAAGQLHGKAACCLQHVAAGQVHISQGCRGIACRRSNRASNQFRSAIYGKLSSCRGYLRGLGQVKMIPIHSFTNGRKGAFIPRDLPTLALFQSRQEQFAVCCFQQGSSCTVHGQLLFCQGYGRSHCRVARQHLIHRQRTAAVDAESAAAGHKSTVHRIGALHGNRHRFIGGQQSLICLHRHVIQYQPYAGSHDLHLGSCIQRPLQAIHTCSGDFRHLSAGEIHHGAALIYRFSGHNQGGVNYVGLPRHAFAGVLQPQVEASVIICPVGRIGIAFHRNSRYSLSGAYQHAPSVCLCGVSLHTTAGHCHLGVVPAGNGLNLQSTAGSEFDFTFLTKLQFPDGILSRGLHRNAALIACIQGIQYRVAHIQHHKPFTGNGQGRIGSCAALDNIAAAAVNGGVPLIQVNGHGAGSCPEHPSAAIAALPQDFVFSIQHPASLGTQGHVQAVHIHRQVLTIRILTRRCLRTVQVCMVALFFVPGLFCIFRLWRCRCFLFRSLRRFCRILCFGSYRRFLRRRFGCLLCVRRYRRFFCCLLALRRCRRGLRLRNRR